MTTTAPRAAALAVLLCTLTSSTASADFLVEPFFAWTKNPDTARWVPGGGTAAEWTTGWLVVGGDLGYAAGFFDPPEDALDLVASSHVITVGGQAGIGWPARKESDRYFPYFTGGFGWMRQSARDREGFISVVRNDPSVNFGGGIRVLLNDFLGVRVDMRYFRSMRDPFPEPDPLVDDLERLHFWRVGVGAVIRFGHQ